MKASVELSCPVVRSARVVQAEGLFDIPPADRAVRTIAVDLPIDGTDWQIGLIVGPSGSGKTQAAKALFPRDPKRVEFVTVGDSWVYPGDRSVLDSFPSAMGVKDVTALLSSVGFSSPPSWVKPWHVLSTGERFRVDVARAIADPAPLVVVDEFTSVVDRTVARIGSAAVAKAVRRVPGKRLVAVTCHEDVAEWLDPDWALVMPEGAFRAGRALRRPPITLDVGPCHRSIWTLFSPHHYLDAAIHNSAACFVARLDGRPVAFAGALAFPHPTRSGFRETRLVCLPDFQGVGIGNALSEMVASAYKARGPYFSTTGNPAMVAHRTRRKDLWRLVRRPGRNATGKNRGPATTGTQASKARDRITASFEYIGPAARPIARAWGVVA